MKYATLLLGLAILLASVAVAEAKVDRKCVREMRELGWGLSAVTIRRQCNPANFVTNPNEYGWESMPSSDCIPYRVKGSGAKFKRDAVCE